MGVVAVAAAILVLGGCEAILDLIGMGDDPLAFGSIDGIARYVNDDDHSGIVVSLEYLDGARAASFDGAVASRSMVSRTLAGQTTTGTDGAFTFDRVPPGRYTVYASSENSSEGAVRTDVTVEADRAVTMDDLELTATGSITGQIVNGTTGEAEAGWIIGVVETS